MAVNEVMSSSSATPFSELNNNNNTSSSTDKEVAGKWSSMCVTSTTVNDGVAMTTLMTATATTNGFHAPSSQAENDDGEDQRPNGGVDLEEVQLDESADNSVNGVNGVNGINHQNGHANAGRAKSCQVDFFPTTDAEERRRRRKMRRQRRVMSAVDPPVMTTQTALVAELKDVLRRKGGYVEVVPDGRDDGELPEEEEEVEHGMSNDDDSEGDDSEYSPDEQSRNAVSPLRPSSQQGNGVARMYSRTVRCAIVGDNSGDFFVDCQAHPSAGRSAGQRTSFDVTFDGSLVDLCIVGVIDADNKEEIGQLAHSTQNADVFLTLFKEEQILRTFWLPEIRQFNADLPIVLASGLSVDEGRSIASQVGAVDYLDLASSGHVGNVFQQLVKAVLAPSRPVSSAIAAPITEATAVSADGDEAGNSTKVVKPKNRCCCVIS